MKRNVKYLIIIIFVLVAITSIATYAYFGANVVSNDINDVNVSSGKLQIKIDDNSINASENSPIYDADYEMLAYNKDFELISDSSLNACSKLSLHINEMSESLKSEYFKYRIIGEGIDETGDFRDAKVGEDLVLLNNLYLEKGTTKYFDLYLWVSYQKDVDQLDMLGTKIDSNLVVSGVDSKTEDLCNKNN